MLIVGICFFLMIFAINLLFRFMKGSTPLITIKFSLFEVGSLKHYRLFGSGAPYETKEVFKIANIKLCKTKAGKGFKIVVGDEWFYTSKYEMYRLLKDEANACDFRTIDDDDNNGGQPEKQADPCMVVQDDPDDFDFEETGWTKDWHAWQEHILEHDDGGEE